MDKLVRKNNFQIDLLIMKKEREIRYKEKLVFVSDKIEVFLKTWKHQLRKIRLFTGFRLL